ncbi:DNA polymerase alpha/epsilon subunit B-domain-containing protein [Lipomyces kononenkoae]|uniref:DNA polymerase alpha/epsilon subunit B-domain-containing protein n=1 Tax=Lipomyces kononenkoae TaxID=34357 RepID=A0ACC3SZ99_LIPKO
MPSIEQATMAPHLGDQVDPEIETVCQSLQKSYNLSPSDLFYKIESYRLELAGKDDISTVPVTKQLLDDLRQEFQAQLERKQLKQRAVNAGSAQIGSSPSQGVTPAKRRLPGSALTPTPLKSSPFSDKNGTFATRTDAGKVLETLNGEIEIDKADDASPEKAKITAFMDIKKYHYRTMRQLLLETSEYLDERIERFADLVQEHLAEEVRKNDNPDEVLVTAAERLSNPAAITHEDVIVVGRVVSDSVHAADSSKINETSVLLETSRRMGSGARVPFKLSLEPQAEAKRPTWFSLFPGQIVALRGCNPSGSMFIVREVLSLPELPCPVSPLRTLRQTASHPTRMIIAKGPFTTQDDIAFAPLTELIDQCISAKADVVVLLGPFIDTTHPCLIDPGALPYAGLNTLEDLFRTTIAAELRRLESALANVQTFLVPESSEREAVQRHVSFPTPPVADAKKTLGMPKRSKWLCNPAFVAVNSSVLAITNVDILMQLSKVEYLHRVGSSDTFERNILARGVRNLLQQRSLYPVFPGQPDVPLEISYLGLAEMNLTRPDILIVPSDQRYFAKVVDNVVAINPGALTKLRAAGTYAVVDVAPLEDTKKPVSESEEAENELIFHKVWERCRVDIRKI